MEYFEQKITISFSKHSCSMDLHITVT